jgi:hypothetical protein
LECWARGAEEGAKAPVGLLFSVSPKAGKSKRVTSALQAPAETANDTTSHRAKWP